MSLSKKVVALFVPLLLIQVVLFALMVNVNRTMKSELERANLARNISDAINKITKDSLEIFSMFGADPGALKNFSTNDPMYALHFNRLNKDYDELERLAKNEPELAALAKKSRADALSMVKDLMAARDLHEQKSGDAEKLKWKSIRATLKTVLKDELTYVGKQHEEEAELSRKNQLILNKQNQDLMLLTIFLDCAAAVAIAAIFIRTVSNRLNVMCDNTARLASSVPLNPPIGGKDELGRLDYEFHRMAEELQNSAKKESAIITNARDLICSLDEGGRVIRTNPASRALLGVRDDDLIGRYIVDLVVSEDASDMLAYLSALKNGEFASELEVAMRTTGGENVQTLWSATWSPEEENYFVVIHDISERRRAEELRREVMAMITHDLRSPLMTISNILDFYTRGVFSTTDEKGKKFLQSACRNADRMTALINDLLDIEKIEAGMMELAIDTIPLQECFVAVAETSALVAKEQDIELVFVDTDYLVDCDLDRIIRVLQNLVSNAIKFSPEGSKVRVSAKQVGNFVEVSVADQGPGIPPDMVSVVFDRYRQIGTSKTESSTGSGLGLAICKSIVSLHGGQISVTTPSDGGSEFRFTVPLAKS
ncbi:PAS domain-containing sensor histidine kinase [Candidatus Obscuribacterales bacterium]|nr:PAS domain-containing sensor histidine kinase [Candidatus Obscuribacterales bacterium]MBX3150705.1 PAS domain-containing sensor histidine kinase [Candidatus Obscuribacterales bacterium]